MDSRVWQKKNNAMLTSTVMSLLHLSRRTDNSCFRRSSDAKRYKDILSDYGGGIIQIIKPATQEPKAFFIVFFLPWIHFQPIKHPVKCCCAVLWLLRCKYSGPNFELWQQSATCRSDYLIAVCLLFWSDWHQSKGVQHVDCYFNKLLMLGDTWHGWFLAF